MSRDLLGFIPRRETSGRNRFLQEFRHKLGKRPKLRGMASSCREKMEGKKETEEEEEPKESFGFMRDAFIGGQFVSGASPDLDVGVAAVRVPRRVCGKTRIGEDGGERRVVRVWR